MGKLKIHINIQMIHSDIAVCWVATPGDHEVEGKAMFLASSFRAALAQQAAAATRMAKDTRDVGPSAPTTSVITKVKPKTKRPNLYRVLVLNDDYTPMEFVIYVLEKFFQKDAEAATEIMLHVHHHGLGECGIFTYEIAETKVTQVMDFARKHQHPLQCVMEKANV
jgi:ATP-dependent Clp protease adaptor protein ClpS